MEGEVGEDGCFLCCVVVFDVGGGVGFCVVEVLCVG